MRIKAKSTKVKIIKAEGFYQFCLHGKEIKAGTGFKKAILVCLLAKENSQQIKEKTARKAFQISK
jgi:hypothetical protein